MRTLQGPGLLRENLNHFPVAARNGVTVLSPVDYLAHLLSEESGLK
jgi:hypothetical protein